MYSIVFVTVSYKYCITEIRSYSDIEIVLKISSLWSFFRIVSSADHAEAQMKKEMLDFRWGLFRTPLRFSGFLWQT